MELLSSLQDVSVSFGCAVNVAEWLSASYAVNKIVGSLYKSFQVRGKLIEKRSNIRNLSLMTCCTHMIDKRGLVEGSLVVVTRELLSS